MECLNYLFSNHDARGHILTFFTAFGKIASDERRRVILRVAGLAFCKGPFGQLDTGCRRYGIRGRRVHSPQYCYYGSDVK
jgi:hypothetical protein